MRDFHASKSERWKSKTKIALQRAGMSLLLLSLVALGLIFPFPTKGRLWGAIFDMAHAPTFFVALICLVGFLDPAAIGLPSRFMTLVKMTLRRVLLVTVVLTCVGLAGEYLQKFAGRNPSWGDVVSNSAGLLAAFCFIACISVEGVKRRLFATAAVMVLICVSIAPACEAWTSIQQMRDFPLLASFERSGETGSWHRHRSKIQQSAEWASDGQFSAKVTLNPADYPGASMVWFERDWSAYKQLRLTLFNPGDQSMQLVVKLYDQQHAENGFDYDDRFHRAVTIAAHKAIEVSINLTDVEQAAADRSIRLDEMSAVDIFGFDIKRPTVFFVDDLRLVP